MKPLMEEEQPEGGLDDVFSVLSTVPSENDARAGEGGAGETKPRKRVLAAPHQQPSPSFHNMTGLATDAEVTELYESKKQAWFDQNPNKKQIPNGINQTLFEEAKIEVHVKKHQSEGRPKRRKRYP